MLNPYSLTIIWSRPTGISVDHEWWEIVQFHTPATLNVTDDDDCWSFAKMLIGGGGKKNRKGWKSSAAILCPHSSVCIMDLSALWTIPFLSRVRPSVCPSRSDIHMETA